MKTRGLLAAVASLAGAALTAALDRPQHLGRTSYHNGWRQFQRGHRIRPHQGEREIARRLRQAERDKQNQLARDVFGDNGYSRRWRLIP